MVEQGKHACRYERFPTSEGHMTRQNHPAMEVLGSTFFPVVALQATRSKRAKPLTFIPCTTRFLGAGYTPTTTQKQPTCHRVSMHGSVEGCPAADEHMPGSPLPRHPAAAANTHGALVAHPPAHAQHALQRGCAMGRGGWGLQRRYAMSRGADLAG
jgi:hypothetical protein